MSDIDYVSVRTYHAFIIVTTHKIVFSHVRADWYATIIKFPHVCL